jgi:hypothetical protein
MRFAIFPSQIYAQIYAQILMGCAALARAIATITCRNSAIMPLET